MTARIANISFDARDSYSQMVWWDQVLHDFDLEEGADEPGDPECALAAADGTLVLFQQVPETKTVKNRIHLCLVAADGNRDSEVERVRALGAMVVDDRRTVDGRGWVVFADPEGNEFCIVRTRAEIEADHAAP